MAGETRRALIVGFGSAGQRHARVLQVLGLKISVVSRRQLPVASLYHDVSSALRSERPDYVVVANETGAHLQALAEVAAAGFRGLVLVEKPLSADGRVLAAHDFAGLYIGYQLRFHPVVTRLRTLLPDIDPLSVHAQVAQHLASWRPQRDYRDSYSSRTAEGGGALRDLSHEIDLLLWLFGAWNRLAALGGTHGVLDIESDDAWAVLMELDGCPLVTLQLNYLDPVGRRDMIVAGSQGAAHADLLHGTLRSDDGLEEVSVEPDEPTRALHEAVLNEDTARLCTVEQGQAVMQAISAIKSAAERRSWSHR